MTQCLSPVSYGRFSERLHVATGGRRIPLDGSLELTERCNLRCVHCYISRPLADPESRESELTTEELFHVIDEIADEGCLWLLLTGGEPLVRHDFLDVWDHAKKRGLLLTLFTNGTLLTPEIATHLAEWAPFSVEVTLYGATERTYEEVTGVPGSYRKCRNGIDLLLANGVPLKLKTMVLTLNRQELDAMRSFADRLGVEFEFDPVINMRLDGGAAPARFRLPPEEAVPVEMADPARRKAWRELHDLMRGTKSDGERLFSCGAGLGTFHVDARGRLHPCLMVRHRPYSLRDGSFREGWRGWLPSLREQKRSTETPCRTCDVAHLCGQCPGHAAMETGSPESLVPYLCRIGQLRNEALAKGGMVRGR